VRFLAALSAYWHVSIVGNGPPFRRVTLTVTVRVSRVSVVVSVRDSVK